MGTKTVTKWRGASGFYFPVYRTQKEFCAACMQDHEVVDCCQYEDICGRSACWHVNKDDLF